MTGPRVDDDGDDLPEPPFAPSLVIELQRTFGKAVRAHQLYLPNNPMHARAIQAARNSFRALWEETDSVALQVTDSGFQWEGRPVLDEPGRTSDSVPWLFFKDGIRELVFHRDFENDEMLALLTLIQRARLASVDDDDLLTMLWEKDFTCLQYRYVDLAMDGGAPIEGTRREQPARIASTREIEGEAQVLVMSSLARMEEYDSTLYFLDDGEIDYLQSEIRKDFSTDMRTHVIASLLDTYERETDPTVREEIAGILDNFFLLLLSLTQFRSAAYLIREAAVTAARASEILLAQRQRLMQLSDRLSEKDALEQLLHALEETPLRPPQNDLDELFTQLKPAALSTILSWIGRSRNAELRALLESAGSRLAASHTGELIRLISSDDEVVAFEAIRRAGAMKASAAVAALAGTIAHGSPEMRHAGVAALSEIGSPGALQVLERALQDEDRDIRVAAVRMLGLRNHQAAATGIEAHIRSRALKDGTLAEKMAFFEAFGLLCGDSGVPLLDDILNSKKLLGRREDGEMRACAAMGLGRVGSERAMAALQGALVDRDVVVRNAVSRALRG
ncbi:MAG: HEAT repeat domain-containing protein [Gemmatimonadaceae bacterium]|nr:HEAT repeat domain-containing protein [Gemmatimonadaceae bacterium]